MTAKQFKTYMELMEQLKQYCDTFLSEHDMTFDRLLWSIGRINMNAPVWMALCVAEEVLSDWHKVQKGIIPHW